MNFDLRVKLPLILSQGVRVAVKRHCPTNKSTGSSDKCQFKAKKALKGTYH